MDTCSWGRQELRRDEEKEEEIGGGRGGGGVMMAVELGVGTHLHVEVDGPRKTPCNSDLLSTQC